VRGNRDDVRDIERMHVRAGIGQVFSMGGWSRVDPGKRTWCFGLLEIGNKVSV
jgi:hypothetical protein